MLKDLLIGILFLFGFSTIYKLITIININNKIDLEKHKLNNSIINLEDLEFFDSNEFINWGSNFLRKIGYNNVLIAKENTGYDLSCTINGNMALAFCTEDLNENIINKMVGMLAVSKIKSGVILSYDTINTKLANYCERLPKDLQLTILDGNSILKKLQENIS